MEREEGARLDRVIQATGSFFEQSTETKPTQDALFRTLLMALDSSLRRGVALDDEKRNVLSELIDSSEGHGLLTDAYGSSDAVSFQDPTGAIRTLNLWRQRTSGGLSQDRFASIVERAYRRTPADRQSVTTFTPQQVQTIQAGLNMLFQVIPDVATGMLIHVELLCRVVSSGSTNIVQSGSLTDIPGVVFLGDTALTTPVTAAEHILHEACHQRYRGFVRSMSILAADYSDKLCSRVSIPWHRFHDQAQLWRIDKALTAAHVYLHVAYFYGMLCDAHYDSGQRDALLTKAYSTLERARYLLTCLDATGRVHLGYAGNLLLDWMMDTAASFGLAPSAEGRLTRLVLERYIEGDSEFDAARAAFTNDLSGDSERTRAFMSWIGELEPSASQRFAKCFTDGSSAVKPSAANHGSPGTLFETVPGDALARYQTARHERSQMVRSLLTLPPEELARRTNHHNVLTFVQTESANLANFLDSDFRDQLMHRNAHSPRAAMSAT